VWPGLLRMEAGDARSSSNDLSSAPTSDIEGPLGAPPSYQSPTSNLGAPREATTITIQPMHNLGVAPAGHGPPTGTAPATAAGDRQDKAPVAAVKTRKPRKKKDPAESGTAPGPEKKERAPRKPRGASAAAAASGKRRKLEPTENGGIVTQSTAPAPDLQSSTLVQPLSFPPVAPPDERREEAAKYSRNGFSMHDGPMRNSLAGGRPMYSQNSVSAQPPPSSLRSTAIYDPVRSVTIQRPIEPTPAPPYTAAPSPTPPRPTFHASASPAISSIIDHPAPAVYSTSTAAPSHVTTPELTSNGGRAVPPFQDSMMPSTVELDTSPPDQTTAKKPAAVSSSTKKPSSEATTRATSPKPSRAKEQFPPAPTGSGLLSSSLFGGDTGLDTSQHKDDKSPNIDLYIDLKDPNNRVINFARMAEEKYGFAALYPRQAAQRDRLARVAAAGAALERSASGSKFGGTSAGESGDDDVSVDIDRDSDNDGDVAMSGMNGAQEPGNSGTDAPGPKRRRRRKMEEYDTDDPFVDDSELLWEAQAAASKDGFFVYSGPLVPEGEKPAVERCVLMHDIEAERILTDTS